MSAPDIEIISYGGGDLLRMVFNAISMLFYGSQYEKGIVHPLCVISALIGGAWGISRCFFQSYTDGFLTKYFLPLLALPTLLIVPQARVHIIDKIDDKPHVIEHVPLLFAKIAGLSSYLGYELTQAIESVMHTPNDIKYSKTGMIFGADTSLDFSRLRLNNGTLAQNLSHFTQQCIIYDIALRRYTIDELRKSTDLLSFLREKTSKVRMIPYVSGDKNIEYLSCVESVDQMAPLFNKEVQYYTKHEVLKKLPVSYQVLLGFQKQSEQKVSEQLSKAYFGSEEETCKDIIVVNAFNDATSRFATERAKDNQRSMYQTAGALAGNSLVTMRIVFEALIYASCILILPLSLLPGGLKFISGWIFLNIWIQLWPPLYGILNYITMLSAQKIASSIMGGVSSGFSLFTSSGFQVLAYDTAALGGYLSLSVPILSFYILQNLQSITHLTTSLFSPAHSAASSAASELSSGNYSYGNTSLSQFSYENQTAFQKNSAPTLSSGFFTDNYGSHQVKYGQEILTVNQDPSHLNTSISIAEAYTHSMQNAMQNAQSRLESTQGLYTETRGIAERNTADLMQHMSSSEAFSDGYNNSEIQATQKSANWILNASESWGHQHGLNARESLEYFSSMGVGGSFILEGKVGHSGNCNTLSDEGIQSAENLFHSKDFQEHFQRVLNSTHNEVFNSMTDEGKRFSENYATSMEKLKSTQEQFSSAYTDLNQISENLSYIESNTNTINTNLNTEFSNWLHERGALQCLFDKNRETELNLLRGDFISEKCEQAVSTLTKFQNPEMTRRELPNLDNDWYSLKNSVEGKAKDMNLSKEAPLDRYEGVAAVYESQNASVGHQFATQQAELTKTTSDLKNNFQKEEKKGNQIRLNERFGSNLKSIYNNTRVSWFDDYANPK